MNRKPIDNLNRAIPKKEIKFILKKKKLSEKKYLGTDCFNGSSKHVRKKSKLFHTISFRKYKRREHFSMYL